MMATNKISTAEQLKQPQIERKDNPNKEIQEALYYQKYDSSIIYNVKIVELDKKKHLKILIRKKKDTIFDYSGIAHLVAANEMGFDTIEDEQGAAIAVETYILDEDECWGRIYKDIDIGLYLVVKLGGCEKFSDLKELNDQLLKSVNKLNVKNSNF